MPIVEDREKQQDTKETNKEINIHKRQKLDNEETKESTMSKTRWL